MCGDSYFVFVSSPHPPTLKGIAPLIRSPRTDGYAPIRDYAATGDGRTAALVALDGSIDWLCLPDLDSPSTFSALLDADHGGRFVLTPDGEYTASRRYVPGTNVLETTFTTATGAVRVTDAMTLPQTGFAPYRELVRRIDGLAGHVALRWHLEPRLRYGSEPVPVAWRGGVPTMAKGRDAPALLSWDASEATVSDGGIEARFEASEGSVGHLVLSAAHQEPLVYPARDDVQARLAATLASWREWSAGREYHGPWPDAVLRSALALKLLVFAPSGAIAAAATTSLPEDVGGTRNWDRRMREFDDAGRRPHSTAPFDAEHPDDCVLGSEFDASVSTPGLGLPVIKLARWSLEQVAWRGSPGGTSTGPSCPLASSGHAFFRRRVRRHDDDGARGLGRESARDAP